MNSSLTSRRMSSKAAAAALAAAIGFSGVAVAQDGFNTMNQTPPSLDGTVEAAKPITLPQGATIGGTGEKVRDMASQASRSLEELIGNAVVPRTEAEVKAFQEHERRVLQLEMQLKEAKLAKELWVEMNGEQEVDQGELERLHEEKASLEAELMRLHAQQAMPQADPDPVVAEVTGAGGANRAKILVPYSGEVIATVGTGLPNGMKVVSISKQGVTVEVNGERRLLAFGNSVPATRPIPVTPQAAASGLVPALQQISN